MPGRKKGRQRGGAGSKAQCHRGRHRCDTVIHACLQPTRGLCLKADLKFCVRPSGARLRPQQIAKDCCCGAKRWNDALRDAKEDLASERKTKIVRPGDAAPPRLSAQGFRSLATLLHQRVRADQIETGEAGRTPRSNVEPGQGEGEGAPSARETIEESYFLAEWSERTSFRRTRNLTLLSRCIVQIGRDFLEYRTEDEAIAQAFRILPARCISRISRAASARGTISDHNIGLLCSPGVGSLWLRGRFTDEGADALLPTLRGGNSTDGKRDPLGSIAELVHEFREDPEDGNDSLDRVDRVDGIDSARAKRGSVCGVTEVGEVESWETADDRMEACLQGGVSITSLDISSPLMTPGFIARLVLRMPTLRRLGLRGSLDVVGGPDALCDYVPRLTALRELDVSYCTWFCDLCLRRFAKTMYREFPASGLNEISGRGKDSHSQWMIAMAQEQEGAADWGAASAPAMRSGGYLPAHGRPEALGTAERLPGGVRTSGVGPRGGGVRERANAKNTTRFRTFTLTCLRTTVTQKGARRAESLSPGLMVVLEDYF